MHLAAGAIPGANGRTVKNDHFRVRTNPRDHFGRSIWVASLEMALIKCSAPPAQLA
jgi:hypothetical protein